MKILIVEDNEAMQFLLKITIEEFCKNVLIAHNGEEAVEICLNNPDIDLILMDSHMPTMDGYEATREIRKFNKKVIIIAQSACMYPYDEEKILEVGINDIITKPIDDILLEDMIEKYVPNELRL